MIKCIMHLLGYKYRVVIYRTEVWSPLKREMLIVYRCPEKSMKRSLIEKRLLVDMESLLLIIWNKKPFSTQYFKSMDDFIEYCSVKSNFHKRMKFMPEIAGIWYSPGLTKINVALTLTFRDSRIPSPKWRDIIGSLGNFHDQVCIHPPEYHIPAFPGRRCSRCGQKL